MNHILLISKLFNIDEIFTEYFNLLFSKKIFLLVFFYLLVIYLLNSE
jgi:hypothetical protein